MHLKIKPENNSVKAYYENHTEFHEGDSGLDLFVPEEVKVPGKAIGFKINMMISCEAFGRDDREPVGLGNISYYLYPIHYYYLIFHQVLIFFLLQYLFLFELLDL